mmetsp:Transcript_16006/g.43629  ORF Transcript_16006/g.43629 Transcript_16006/m.43629 type:complete len:267 (+) Transcript_16006:162-962(+)
MSTMRVRVKLSLQHPPDQGLANSGGSQQNLEVRQVPQNQGCQVASILHRLRGSVAASTKARTPWMTVLSRPTSTCCTSSGATLGAISRSLASAAPEFFITRLLIISFFRPLTMVFLEVLLRPDQATISSRKNSANTCWMLVFLCRMAWAALTMAMQKMPSTPKPEKKDVRLRVSLKGTASMFCSMPERSSYTRMSSVWAMQPVSFAMSTLKGVRPPSSSMRHSRPARAVCMHSVFLNAHRWLEDGRLLYTYCANTFSDTMRSHTSW